jgi:hypothetical protein
MIVPKFKSGDRANVATRNGEVTVAINSEELNGFYHVGLLDEDGLFTGRTEQVEASRLMPLRGPYFAIRGQVLTTSSSHSGEAGEIVGTGFNKSTKSFFKVRFSDGVVEWFSEDQVFIDDEVKREYDEAQKDGQFFK